MQIRNHNYTKTNSTYKVHALFHNYVTNPQSLLSRIKFSEFVEEITHTGF